MSSDSKLGFPKLAEKNYTSWVENMRSYLQMKRVWRIVTGDKLPPPKGTSEYDQWLDDSDSAAGIIVAGLEDSQRIHVKNMEDPVQMWQAVS